MSPCILSGRVLRHRKQLINSRVSRGDALTYIAAVSKHGDKTNRFRLPRKVSFRALPDFTVLLNHRTHDILRLNPAAGVLLEALDRGEADLGEDSIEFIEQLVRRGHVVDTSRKIRAQSSTRNVVQDGDDDILGGINWDAAEALIPLNCQLELTYRCPLGCKHCYLPPGARAQTSELSFAEITDLLDQLAELGCLFLLLTGGEPFARRDFEKIFSAARDRRFAVSFLTSGFGAEHDLLVKMAERGIDAAQVSLYGADAATHDGLTGVNGSFDAAITCLRTLRDLKVRVRAGVTLTKRNIESLHEIKQLLTTEGIPAALGTHLEPRRDGDDTPLALSVDEEGIRSAYKAFPPTSPPRLATRGLDDPVCGAGANVLAVSPLGDVLPCLSLRTNVGSIRENKLGRIWQGSEKLAGLRAIRVRDLQDCPECELRPSCNRCSGFAVSDGLDQNDHSSLDCLEAKVLNNLKV